MRTAETESSWRKLANIRARRIARHEYRDAHVVEHPRVYITTDGRGRVIASR